MNDKGSQNFIKLDRELLYHALIKDPFCYQLFSYCLLRAEWQQITDQGVEVPRGSFMTTIGEIANDLGCSYQNVKTRLNKLTRKYDRCLTRLKVGKRLMITVSNYDKWQGTNSMFNSIPTPKNGFLPLKNKNIKKDKDLGGVSDKWET